MIRTGDISAQPWFRPAIAAWFALLFGGGTLAILLAIPREVLEWRLGAIGLADLHPAFAAPIGGMGLLPIAGLAALAGLAAGLFIAERVSRQQQPRALERTSTPWEDDGEADEPVVKAEETGKVRVLSARDDIDEEGIPAPPMEAEEDEDESIWLTGAELVPDAVENIENINETSDVPDVQMEDAAEIEPDRPLARHFSEWRDVGSLPDLAEPEPEAIAEQPAILEKEPEIEQYFEEEGSVEEQEIILEAPEPVAMPESDRVIATPDWPRPQAVAPPDLSELSLDALASRLGRAMKDHQSRGRRLRAHGTPNAATVPVSDLADPVESDLGAATPAGDDPQNALRHALEKLDRAGKHP